jgi:predicted ATPase
VGEPTIPAEATSLVGRARELSDLTRLSRAARLVTVTGAGGVGKTRVALRAAALLAPAFADGARWVDLSSVRDGALLGHAIGRALRLVDQTARPQIEVLAEYLSDKRLLLVLDTCEQFAGPCARLVEFLLRKAPHLHIVATSRQPLDVKDEEILPILPLAVPDHGWRRGRELPEAVALFVERAERVGFALTEQNSPLVAGLCRRLDGIPLAIELAAGGLAELTLAEIVARQDDLPVNDGAVPARHQTLRTAVGWSHELCTSEQRLLWARLSVFAGEFDLDAVRYICTDEHLPPTRIPVLLSALVDRSILLRGAEGGEVRYRMLDTVRQYGADWLAALGEQTRLRIRHRDWYQVQAERGEIQWFGPGQAEVFARIRREHANLAAALEFSLATESETWAGLRLAANLWFYWVGCGQLAEGRHWLDRALSVVTEPLPERAKALWVNGYITVLQGDCMAAVPMLVACRRWAERTGDQRALAYSVHRLGCAALIADDHETAVRLFREALGLYKALDELNSNVIMARVELAMALAFQGDLSTAEDICAEVRRTCEEHGERWAMSYALYVLAFAAWTRDDMAEATALAREALRINYAFHDLIGIVLPIELLALLRTEGGREEHQRAAVLQGAVQPIWRSVGPPLFGSAYFNAPHAECERRLRNRLGDHYYAAAVASGTGLGLAEAVAHALGEIPSREPA